MTACCKVILVYHSQRSSWELVILPKKFSWHINTKIFEHASTKQLERQREDNRHCLMHFRRKKSRKVVLYLRVKTKENPQSIYKSFLKKKQFFIVNNFVCICICIYDCVCVYMFVYITTGREHTLTMKFKKNIILQWNSKKFS